MSQSSTFGKISESQPLKGTAAPKGPAHQQSQEDLAPRLPQSNQFPFPSSFFQSLISHLSHRIIIAVNRRLSAVCDRSIHLDSTVSKSLTVVENSEVADGLSSSFYSSEMVDYDSERVEETFPSDKQHGKSDNFLSESFYSFETVDYGSERVEETLPSDQLRVADFLPSPISNAVLDEKCSEMTESSRMSAMGSSQSELGCDLERMTKKEFMKSLIRI